VEQSGNARHRSRSKRGDGSFGSSHRDGGNRTLKLEGRFGGNEISNIEGRVRGECRVFNHSQKFR
jgi:hypothetical protein